MLSPNDLYNFNPESSLSSRSLEDHSTRAALIRRHRGSRYGESELKAMTVSEKKVCLVFLEPPVGFELTTC